MLGGLPDHRAVFANGYIARDGFDLEPSRNAFSMLGSMGLAASIGLGVALVRPEVPIVVLDGDGNLLMGLGVLPMIGAWRPRRFLHVVLDNGTYASTGGQPTISAAIDFPAAALAAGYARAASSASPAELAARLADWRDEEGPSLLHVPVDPREGPPAGRVSLEPAEVARRFARSLDQGG